jgi:Family of unknown function (DUF6101)
MTGATTMAGAVSPRESGPGSILPSLDHPVSRIPALLSPAIAGAGATAAGIVLRLASPEGEKESFEIAVVDAYGIILLPLGRFSDEEAVAEWRKLGAGSGLPLIIERVDWSFDLPYPQLGRVQLGAIRIRRRHGLLNGRRPRFLTRRKTGRLPLRPAVHREREIISRGR